MDIKRDFYLNKLIKKQWNGFIKIITGLRRCGKSYLLFNIFKNYLINNGISKNNIIELELDRRSLSKYHNPDELLNYVISRINDDEKYYLFIDEIQLCDDFVSVLNDFLHYDNIDVYVTGSNSKFLSKDILTDFRGRGDEIHLLPLSLLEIIDLYNNDYKKAINDYYKYGGMPKVLLLDNEKDKKTYLKDLYMETYLKDIIERNNLKNSYELEKLLEIIASSIGSLTNPLKLSNTFISHNLSLSVNTITNYLNFLKDSFIIEESNRYDIKGKKYINSLSKYYFTDPGLRNALLNFRQIELSHIMENIIYNELIRRGFNVDIGILEVNEKNSDNKYVRKQLECDFIVNNCDKKYYIQSAYNINSDDTMNQELRPLRLIPDSFQKIVVRDENIVKYINDDGILFISLQEFLLDEKLLED